MGDVTSLLGNASVWAALLLLGIVIFAESGLLIGVFLPGDTLLFTAGFFAAQGKFPLGWVLFVIFLGAVLGDNVGYFFGHKTGPKIFRNATGIFFRRDYIDKAKTFYDKHGGKTVMFARFVPYARTFAPVIAGATGMRRIKFIAYNLIGAFIWTVGFVMVGYWLGVELASRIENYLTPIFIAALLFTFTPTIMYFITHSRVRKAFVQEFKELFTGKKD